MHTYLSSFVRRRFASKKFMVLLVVSCLIAVLSVMTLLDAAKAQAQNYSPFLSIGKSNAYVGAWNVSYELDFIALKAIDPGRPFTLTLPTSLTDSVKSIDPSKVFLNNIAISAISQDGTIRPGPGTKIAVDQAAKLVFTKEAGLRNPLFGTGESPTGFIKISFQDKYVENEIMYFNDPIAPSGSIEVYNIPASGTTFSRSILLNLSATDNESGVVQYELSEDKDSLNGDRKLEFKKQVPFVLSAGAGSKTIYVKYYDGAGNASQLSEVKVNYDDKLNLKGLTVKDEYDADVALSPAYSDEKDTYYAFVSSKVNHLKINVVKSADHLIEVADTRAVYTPGVEPTTYGIDPTSGTLTFSNLDSGSNDIKIRVSAAGSSKDYHLIIYKEGPVPVLSHKDSVPVSNGSLISLGGQQWVLSDKDKRQLILSMPYITCSSGDYECNWDGNRSAWRTEGDSDGYVFDPERPGSIAYYLNHRFLMGLGAESQLLSLYPFDNTIYSAGTTPLRWGTERRVMASVGLLSIPQFQSLSSDIRSRLSSNWFLMNPAHTSTDYYMYSVDTAAKDNLVANDKKKKVHPVVYLQPNVLISGGGGTESNPYTLTSLSSNADIQSIQYQNKALDYSGTSTPTVYSVVIPAESMKAELVVTMDDPTASIVVDSIKQPIGGGAQASLTGKTIQVSGLTKGVTTLRVYGLAADQITKSYYDVKITKQAPASTQNAVLSSLYVGNIMIKPDSTNTLRASVSNAVYNISITDAVYQAHSMSIAPGLPGTGLAKNYYQRYDAILDKEVNVFTIVVTAWDEKVHTYTLNIFKTLYPGTGGDSCSSDGKVVICSGTSGGSGGSSAQQDVAVTAAKPLITMGDGTSLDFTGFNFGPDSKVSISEVAPQNIVGTTLKSAGKTLEFTLTGLTFDPLNPVKVTMPVDSHATLGKVGIFYYNPATTGWEYQKTVIDPVARTATMLATHFSTYGVFEADKVATPVIDSLYMNPSTKQITLSTSTVGAAVYYTLDGSMPTTASYLYDPINKPKLSPTQTLKAIAVKNGMITSDESTIVGTRITITHVLTSILNQADQNGDKIFDQTDVRALLNQVEPVRGQ